MLSAFSKSALPLVLFLLVLSVASYTQNQVLGEVQFVRKTKVEKTSGVWIDGKQKITIKTDLVPGSITQAGSSIKKD
jgi:hypothetical protein